MSTRRMFLKQTAAAGALTAASIQIACAGKVAGNSGSRIKSAIRREETTLRLGGIGDNYHMSWAADDRQFTAVCDGTGWFDPPRFFYNSRLFTIAGEPQQAKFEDVAGYPELTTVHGSQRANRYYGFGTLAVDGHVYQYLSTPNHVFDEPGAHFAGAKLIYSSDNGRTWRNQDGATPVKWEPWADRSRGNMIFFEEDQDAFALISLLQMGRDYGHNSDGYVYGYSPNGSIEGTMNQLVMFRVPKGQVRERSAYRFFSGLKSGEAQWSGEMAARVPVISFPSGWVNKTVHPWAWMPSVTYNAPLGLYMMASWGNGPSPQGEWFGKPSYLGLWTASTPWGPWTQIHEETAWMPAGDAGSRAFAPQIAPKWIAADGRSFWLVWSDFQTKDAEIYERTVNQLLDRLNGAPMTEKDLAQAAVLLRKHQPGYAFNTQRVDLVL